MVCYFLLFSMFITHSKNKRNWVSVRLCYNRLPYTQGGKGGGGKEYQLHITPIIFKHSRITRITGKINKILGYNNINQRSRNEKKGRSWCHSHVFLMSLPLVSHDINHYGNFKGKSWVTRCENSKSRNKLLRPITPLAANLGPITHHADRSHQASRKTPLPPCILSFWVGLMFFSLLQLTICSN